MNGESCGLQVVASGTKEQTVNKKMGFLPCTECAQ